MVLTKLSLIIPVWLTKGLNRIWKLNFILIICHINAKAYLQSCILTLTDTLLRQNDVATSFWRYNDVIIMSWARWDFTYMYMLLDMLSISNFFLLTSLGGSVVRSLNFNLWVGVCVSGQTGLTNASGLAVVVGLGELCALQYIAATRNVEPTLGQSWPLRDDYTTPTHAAWLSCVDVTAIRHRWGTGNSLYHHLYTISRRRCHNFQYMHVFTNPSASGMLQRSQFSHTILQYGNVWQRKSFFYLNQCW